MKTNGANDAAEADGAQLNGIIRRLNWRLMPLLLLMYVMAFLDRTNVGFASDALVVDIGISKAAYALGASLFFVGYAVLEVPSNMLLKRFGARMWLSRIMITWGLVSAAMVLVRGEYSFYALRMLLGVTEAGFFPGIVYYLTRFYPAHYHARAIGFFYVGAPLSFILGGPVSGALLQLAGLHGLQGWQWLFLVEGLITSAVGVFAFFMLPNGPEDARWLTLEDRAQLDTSLASNTQTEHMHGLLEALRLPAVLYLGGIYLLLQAGVYGLVFFMPSQIAALLGSEIGAFVGFVSTVPWIAALAATLLIPALADRSGRHLPLAAALLTGAALGLAGGVILVSPLLGLACLSLAASSFIAAQPLFWTLAGARIPARRSAECIAFINSMGATGAFLAPNLRVGMENLYDSADAGIYSLAALCIVASVMVASLKRPAQS